MDYEICAGLKRQHSSRRRTAIIQIKSHICSFLMFNSTLLLDTKMAKTIFFLFFPFFNLCLKCGGDKHIGKRACTARRMSSANINERNNSLIEILDSKLCIANIRLFFGGGGIPPLAKKLFFCNK